MPINVDWLGEGWTYYTNEERAIMEGKKAAPMGDITGWRTMPLPASREERMMLALAACGSLRCAVVPLHLLDVLIAVVPHNMVRGTAMQSICEIRDDAMEAIRMTEAAKAAANN